MHVDRLNWTLLAIAAAAGDALTPVQLQKALFLIGQTFPSVDQSTFYSFKPYNYGPFCQSVYADAETLCANGLISIASLPNQSWSSYMATETGLARSKELLNRLDEPQAQYLMGLVRWLRELSFEQLLSFVYEKYPDYAVNSMFRVRK